jgi:N6-adenosine-specific RNA methylase IME4
MIPFPNKKYSIIYADPPWGYNSTSKNGTSRGVAEKYYDTMELQDIKELPIKEIADDNSLLFMWITFPHLHELKEILDALGFTYKTVAFTWVKIYKHTKNPVLACGYWTRSNAEICILATRGKDYPRRISAGVSQIIVSEQRKHSQKPDEARKRIIDLLGDLPRIELFARQKTEGWDVWGNEV